MAVAVSFKADRSPTGTFVPLTVPEGAVITRALIADDYVGVIYDPCNPYHEERAHG